MKEIATERFLKAHIEVMQVYNETALLVNSCHVARERYENMKDPNFTHLSTTRGIPPEYRLSDFEIDYVFSQNDLIEQYRQHLIEAICKNYLVNIVSVFDVALEDIYEKLLQLYHVDISEKKLNALVRAAWMYNKEEKSNLRNFFVNDLGLQAAESDEGSLDLIFDRYEEIREIRHATIHNNGLLSPKNKKKLQKINENLPPALRENSFVSLMNTGFIHNDIVKLDIKDLCFLRAWFYKVISCFLKIFES